VNNGYYVPNGARLRCDLCTGFLPASQEVWIFVHMDSVTRWFCSCSCLAAHALKLSRGQLATDGEPWAGYRFEVEGVT